MPYRDRSSGERLSSFRRGSLVFDVRDEGSLDGPPVVLLHGFPQRPSSWAKVVPHLHDAGMRTLALDQRGYSPGARPKGRAAYRSRELVDDVCALLDAIGEPAHLVGHDWGAAVGWAVAAAHPDRLLSWTAVSVGHPQAFLRSLRTAEQMRRSWYMAFFQLPLLPERLLTSDAFIRSFLGGSGMTTEMIAAYRREIVMDGALTTALSWYRAIPLSVTDQVAEVSIPTSFVWSDGDVALGRLSAVLTREYVTGDYEFVELPGASHWIPEERPEELAAAIVSRARSVPVR
jgi:pimeloyl-ACP methyl ester carboxylesterase